MINTYKIKLKAKDQLKYYPIADNYNEVGYLVQEKVRTVCTSKLEKHKTVRIAGNDGVSYSICGGNCGMRWLVECSIQCGLKEVIIMYNLGFRND